MPKPGVAFLLALIALLAAVPAQAAQRPEPRIVNGDPTPQGQYPWTVALVQPGTNRAFCGGTVIDENVILTAAHCTIGTRPGEIDVIAGTVDLDNPGVRETVDRISLHPDAEGDSDDIVPRRDASLLTLASPLPLSENIEIMPLGAATAADALATGAPLDISGWGLTDPAGDDTESQMQHATVERVSDASCASIFESLFGDLVFSPADQICAIADGDDDPETTGDVIDTCNGDSGGPLVSPSGGGDPADALTWELIGVTSWGFGCASTLEDPDPNVMVPGVYARIADAQLRGYASAGVDGTDENPAQPAWNPFGDAPEIAKASDESAIFCVGNPLQWDFAPVDQMEQLIRREIVPGVYETVSFTGLYRPDEGDAGDRFICEVHGRATGVGGYGLARSLDAVGIADAPVVQPTIVETQIPVPVPGPVVTVPVPVPVPAPRVEDDADPRVRSVRRSCTRRRVCTFTITASDAGTGVKTVALTLNTVRTRSCRRDGRRTVCASWRATPLRARKVAGTASTFRVTTKRLTRGTHVLHASAVDFAGNIQTTPRAVAFRLR